ncbi:hypothetical protein BD779DRAFT_1703756 [Infundibulicybe gibba]|nr:hypothetical protein BD779DRAFT_1703756 [Infundibulicybe gibba]
MSIMFTQSSAIVDSMVVSLPDAPALDAAQRIVEKRKADLVRRLILAAIFGTGQGVSLEDLENYLAFCGGWAQHVVHRSLRDMASRSAATTVPAFPQSIEIAPVPQNAIVIKKLTVAASKPRTLAPSVEDIASIFSACIPALDVLWLDDLLILSRGLQADIPSMALSTIVSREAHGNIDLILLLASMASSYTASSPLLVDLGSETSITSVASDDDNGDVNTPAVVSPVEAPNKVLAVFAKPQVPTFSAQDIISILGDLDIYVSVPKGLWFDIPTSLCGLQVDVSMYPSKVPQLGDHIDVSLILSLAAKATCCGSSPLLVDVGPSSTSIVEVALDDVEIWADPNQTLAEEVPEVILSPQNVLVKKFSAITIRPQVSTFSARDIVGILGDLHICTPTSKGIWLDLPGLPHGIRLDIPSLSLGTTSQLGSHVNVDLVLLLASMWMPIPV